MSYVTQVKTLDTTAYVTPDTQAVNKIVNSDGSNATAATASTSGGGPLGGVITASTTPQRILVPGRRSGSADTLQIENTAESAQAVYVRSNADVSSTGATRGHKIAAGGTMDFQVGTNGTSLYVVTSTGNATVIWSIL